MEGGTSFYIVSDLLILYPLRGLSDKEVSNIKFKKLSQIKIEP